MENKSQNLTEDINIILRVGMISSDTKWNTNGEDIYLIKIDAEERK